MIQIDIKTKKRNYYEGRVLIILNRCKFYCESLASFRNMFKEEIREVPRKSTAICELRYKLVDIENRVEVWHLDCTGTKDRLVAIVTQN